MSSSMGRSSATVIHTLSEESLRTFVAGSDRHMERTITRYMTDQHALSQDLSQPLIMIT